jgi:hypothetical protein
MGYKATTAPVQVGGTEYETVAASQTAQVLGGVGAKGDLLSRLVVHVATASTATVSITDGTTEIALFTANGGGGIRTESIELGIRAKVGPWKVTTGAGCSVIAIGQFSE